MVEFMDDVVGSGFFRKRKFVYKSVNKIKIFFFPKTQRK